MVKFIDQNEQISKIVYSLLQLKDDSDLVFWNITFDKDKSELVAKFRKKEKKKN